ncbi:MAG: hypothetical protein EBY39_08545 [Flavobacteriia bacterium]|nr:hypothetical protein [Flavobacteriia bacterium]
MAHQTETISGSGTLAAGETATLAFGVGASGISITGASFNSATNEVTNNTNATITYNYEYQQPIIHGEGDPHIETFDGKTYEL